MIQIKKNQKKIIVDIETANDLDTMKELRTHRKPGEHKTETYNAVIKRMIQLVKMAKQIAKSETKRSD